MRFSTLAAAITPALAFAASSSTAPGYSPVASTVTGSFNFGKNYAILNLDLITGLVDAVVNTTAGDAWIKSVAGWIDDVHAKKSPPLQIFTRIYFSPGHPEVGPLSPFRVPAAGLINNTETVGAASDLYSAFHAYPEGYVNGSTKDVVLQKTRYDATFGNQMLEILKAQQIDTVVIVSLI